MAIRISSIRVLKQSDLVSCMGVIRHIRYVRWHSDLSHGLILAATEDGSRSQFPCHSCVLEGLDLSCSYGLHYICL